MSCVSSVSTSILFNGGCLQPLYQSRGIRQGDPLLPYLFIICMDYLGQLIEEKCSENLWKPVRSSKSGPAFLHLMFADDLVLNFWNIGRDSNLNFWFDKWTSSGPLRKLIQGPLSLEESNRKVKRSHFSRRLELAKYFASIAPRYCRWNTSNPVCYCFKKPRHISMGRIPQWQI